MEEGGGVGERRERGGRVHCSLPHRRSFGSCEGG